ncbi:HutD family protein [Crocinitomix sp.]|nr:HutD family protein [Crocinitomix sp.]
MEYKIIRKPDIKTTQWAGGTTSELYIYPESALYAQRNFDFRLSTATVDVWESEFTPLPGISRTLMIMDGVMILKHEEQKELLLKKFDQSNFEGGWKTLSQGKCVDFNLMCSKPYDSELLAFKADYENQIKVDLFANQIYALYNYQGFTSFLINGEEIDLMEGDCCVLLPETDQELAIRSITDVEFVLVRVNLKDYQ